MSSKIRKHKAVFKLLKHVFYLQKGTFETKYFPTFFGNHQG